MALNRHTSGASWIASYLKKTTPEQFAEDMVLIYEAESRTDGGGDACMLDTLKIANIQQEGPTKTITGGQYASALIKFGKTARCEMQEALGREDALRILGGMEKDNQGNLFLTGKFSGNVAICGENYFIDKDSGAQNWVHVIIPQFTPDSILTFTQDAEGDATTFDLNGDIVTSTLSEGTDNKYLDIQAGFVKNGSTDANVFKSFGVVTVMTNVIAIPWITIKKYITKDFTLNKDASGKAAVAGAENGVSD